MQHLLLPRTDLRVSNLCFGTADLGAGIDETTSFALLNQFFAAGGNFLDSAAIYADWTPARKGSSEKLIGKWLSSRKHEVVVATKGGHPELSSMALSRLSAQEVEFDVNQSLTHLGIESIPLYYLHRDDPSIPVAEILSYLEGLVKAGKIRYYGFSNWKIERAQEALETAQATGAHGFVANQPLWSLAKPDLSKADPTLAPMTEQFWQWHRQHGMPAIPYSSQANGYFSKLSAGQPLKGNVSSMYDSDLVRPINRRRLARIEALTQETGWEAAQIVLGYLLAQPFPVIPIIGSKNREQLTESLNGAEVKLTTEQLSQLVA